MESVDQILIIGSIAIVLVTWLWAIFQGFRSTLAEGVVLMFLGTLGAVIMLYNGKSEPLRKSCKHHMFSILAVFTIGILWSLVSS